MRSRTNCSVTTVQVHAWALSWLLQAKLVKGRGWRCTATVLLNIVLRAAARAISLSAACRDLLQGPSDQAVMNGLRRGLPRSRSALERRLNAALTGELPRCLRRRKWEVAIDWHLTPYYGQPHRSRNELYYGPPRQGTKKFHAYATACIVCRGERYTVALTWVRRHEATVTALDRLNAQIQRLGLKIKCLLLDRAFFNVPVVQWLQSNQLPFLMPVMFRGRPPKKRRPAKGLHWIKKQPAGWYSHTMKNARRQVTIRVCVGFRYHRHRKDGMRVRQKLLFATWRIHGSSVEIRERYRKRFGIESSYRQLRQARIYTCVRDPLLRLLFIGIALILRNLWVWIHHTRLADGTLSQPQFNLERLRFKRLLDWLVREILRRFDNPSTTYAESPQ